MAVQVVERLGQAQQTMVEQELLEKALTAAKMVQIAAAVAEVLALLVAMVL